MNLNEIFSINQMQPIRTSFFTEIFQLNRLKERKMYSITKVLIKTNDKLRNTLMCSLFWSHNRFRIRYNTFNSWYLCVIKLSYKNIFYADRVILLTAIKKWVSASLAAELVLWIKCISAAIIYNYFYDIQRIVKKCIEIISNRGE